MGGALDWETVKLADIAGYKTGKLNSNAAVENGDYPFFTCSRETFRTNTWSFDCECVLLAGNNANAEYPVKYFKGKFDAYQRTYVITAIDPNRLNIRCLYYCIELKLNLLKSLSTGSATRFLTKGIIDNIEFDLPPKKNQDQIVGVLAGYDNLIENNNRRIAILEEMAQSLYREWFVKFRFPGHENCQFKDSELGRIPEGWGVEKLSDIAEVNPESITKKNAPKEINYVDIKSVNTGSIEEIRPIAFDDAPGRARRKVCHGDTIWATVRPNRKQYSFIAKPRDNMIVSTGFAVLRANQVSPEYLYYAVTTDSFTSYLVNHASGAAYPAVNTKDFENADILVPPKSVLVSFDALVSNSVSESQVLKLKNNNLKQQRDILLPKLISGNISI
jgi:type I restriction enzyme S subunit